MGVQVLSTLMTEVVGFNSFYFNLPSSTSATPAFNQLISTPVAQ